MDQATSATLLGPGDLRQVSSYTRKVVGTREKAVTCAMLSNSPRSGIVGVKMYTCIESVVYSEGRNV
jgi:hypothetical protein